MLGWIIHEMNAFIAISKIFNKNFQFQFWIDLNLETLPKQKHNFFSFSVTRINKTENAIQPQDDEKN